MQNIETDLTDEERSLRRRQRLEEMKRRKKQQDKMRKLAVPSVIGAAVCIILITIGIRSLTVRTKNGANQENEQQEQYFQAEKASLGENMSQTEQSPQTEQSQESVNAEAYVSEGMSGTFAGGFTGQIGMNSMEELKETYISPLGGFIRNNPPLSAASTESTTSLGSDVVSENGIFIDVEAGTILAQKAAKTRISPASMTKILTVLVAAEHVTDLEDTFTMTMDITDYCYINDCSSVGFEVGEEVAVRDLFYGTILPSGADAAVGLAEYVAGSQEAFVELMNEKLDELGLSGSSHFTNCVGLYDENHYSTVYDIAVMLKAAYDNDFCRAVLSEHIYTTAATPQHPEGITISNLFLRRIEDKDTHGEVLCAKTGYVAQSGNCAASLGIDNDGRVYICVTAHSSNSFRCVNDHAALYRQFLP